MQCDEEMILYGTVAANRVVDCLDQNCHRRFTLGQDCILAQSRQRELTEVVKRKDLLCGSRASKGRKMSTIDSPGAYENALATKVLTIETRSPPHLLAYRVIITQSFLVRCVVTRGLSWFNELAAPWAALQSHLETAWTVHASARSWSAVLVRGAQACC